MDVVGWPPQNQSQQQRHKRSHAEMSQATLSPSPITFRGPASSSFASISRYNTSAPASNDLFFERRRTSHPHNPPIHPFQAAAENMPQRSQSQQRPRLEHRTSQTLIDLTEDTEEVIPAVARNRAPSQRPQPPQLGRSDAQGLADVIDLTEDDVEIQITGARNRELPLPHPDVTRPRPYGHAPGHESPDLFVPANQPPHLRNANFPAAGAFGVAVVGGPSRHALHFHHILHGGDGGAGDVLARIIGHTQGQAMPQMDYRHAAFADRKPDHVPPQPAKPGFTRSPTESDTVICPSCEEELVHDKEFNEPMLRKGKAPTRKEREEHPFWVIRECGHVYCNNCYQNRIPTSKQPGSVSFPEKSPTSKGSKKVPMCAVEDCQSEVKNKDKWVGVFL